MKHLRVLQFLLALTTATLALPAVGASSVCAQSSGGSFGGGSFGGGGGGGSYGGGGGGSYGGSSYGGGSYSGGGGEMSLGSAVCMLVILLLIWGATTGLKHAFGNPVGSTPSAHSPRWQGMDVTMMQVAIDWRARAQVQAELDRLARSGMTGTPAGLAKLCREAASALRQTELAWLYARAKNYKPMSPPVAEGEFRALATDARSRFRHEVVRAADGELSSQDGPDVQAKSEEGEGIVVVSIIVAARFDLFDLTDDADARQIGRALDGLSNIQPNQLVALEVIWSPAEEDDRMSSAELQMLYPELRRLNEETVAGRIFCGYCSAPFAAELSTCPHCGAPHQA